MSNWVSLGPPIDNIFSYYSDFIVISAECETSFSSDRLSLSDLLFGRKTLTNLPV